MYTNFIRPRTVPEILDAAFQLLRRHYASIVIATGIVILPADLLSFVLPPEWEGLASLLQNFLLNFASAATVVLVADVYLGREPDVGAALRQVGGRAWPVFAAAFCVGLLTTIGTFLCLVPGIIAFALLFAAPIVVMVENRGPLNALERSVDLANDNLLRILGSAAVAHVIVAIVTFGLEMLAGMVEEGSAGLLAQGAAKVIPIFLYPFPVVVSTLMYFDIRIRKEGFGMDDLSAWLDEPAPQPGSSH